MRWYAHTLLVLVSAERGHYSMSQCIYYLIRHLNIGVSARFNVQQGRFPRTQHLSQTSLKSLGLQGSYAVLA